MSPRRTTSEAPAARAHLVVSLLLFLAGVVHLAVAGLSRASLLDALPLIAMGGFVTLIVGTTRMLLEGPADRDVAGARRLRWGVLGLLVVGSAGLYLGADLPNVIPAVAGTIWGAGLVIHVGIVLVTVRRPRRGSATADGDRTLQRWLGGIDAVALLYAVAAAVLVPLAWAGPVPRPVAVHVLLLGFVTLTIVGVVGHVLPRFTHVPLPKRAFLPALGPVAVGPALVAVELAWAPELLFIGAAVVAVGLAPFGVAVLWMLAKAKRWRAPLAAVAAGVSFLLIGVGLGVLFAVDPTRRGLTPLHGAINVLGFVGLFVLGFAAELYAPSIVADPTRFRVQARTALGGAVAGVALVAVGFPFGHDLLVRGGLVLYALACLLHLAGALLAYLRTARPLSIAGSSSPPKRGRNR